MLSLFVSCLLLLVSISVINAQVETLIPNSPNGWSWQRGNLSSNIIVEFFIDLTCSACQEEWPTLNKVVSDYQNKVKFVYRNFPLPYHQQGFILSKAAQVVSQFGTRDAVFSFMDVVYEKQSAIYNSATADLTYNQVVDLVSSWATTGTGVSDTDYRIGMNSSTSIGRTLEMNARYMWKYICLQEVFGTPFFAVNGLKVSGLDSYEDWQKYLDSLL